MATTPVTTTQIYTKVRESTLAEEHASFHPRNRKSSQ